MNDDDLVSVRADIPRDLKSLVDTDSRYNREVIEAALWSEFGGHRKGAIQTRVEEKRRRIGMIESEIQQREQELEKERTELDSLLNKLEEKESRVEATLADAEDVFGLHQLDPDNDAIQTWAGKAGLPPGEFVDRMRGRLERDDG